MANKTCTYQGKPNGPDIPVNNKCSPTIKPSATEDIPSYTPPTTENSEGIQDGEEQETFSVLWILAQDREDAYLRNHLRNPDSSIFHTQKSIKIINLRGLFFITY